MSIAFVANKSYVKSPLNYIGGKYKLLPQILPIFPQKIDKFIDLFCGGLNVAININPQSFNVSKIICNDNLSYLIELYEFLQTNPLQFTLEKITQIIAKYDLSLSNAKGYYHLRSDYNAQKSPLKLLTLIAYSFNHQIRFNNSHEFNNPFGKNRSQFNATMKANLIDFIQILQRNNITFYALDFQAFLSQMKFSNQSFVYADPPYLITQGSYNDGKRGFSGWNERLETTLLHNLESLHKDGVKFALSNVLFHKNKENTLLKTWIKKNDFFVTKLNHHYTNANYQVKFKDKTLTQEVLITNYQPLK